MKEELGRQIASNVARVRETIAAACRRAGRDPASVQLVAVTKYMDSDALDGLLAAGVADLGESRVQQLVERAKQVGGGQPPPAARAVWHMIGHLQRNKVKQLLPHCRILHSLDSLRLAQEVDEHASKLDVTVDAYLEVNVAGEENKGGVAPSDAASLGAAVQAMPHIRLRGLMTMAPLNDDAENSRRYFSRLRELLTSLRSSGDISGECDGLSMGMSQDYAVAVEEGATVVRVGSALSEPTPRGVG